MDRIIAIEGICCSGKSTLVHSLQNMGFGIVKEYGEYASGQFPKTATNKESLLENVRFFIELERRRFEDALVATCANQTLILDRSFVTCCAFNYAAFAKTELSQYQDVIESMWEQEKKKLFPGLIIVLKVKEEGFRLRLQKSGKILTPLLRSLAFNNRFSRYLEIVEARWEIKVVDIETDELSQPQVLSRALDHL